MNLLTNEIIKIIISAFIGTRQRERTKTPYKLYSYYVGVSSCRFTGMLMSFLYKDRSRSITTPSGKDTWNGDGKRPNSAYASRSSVMGMDKMKGPSNENIRGPNVSTT